MDCLGMSGTETGYAGTRQLFWDLRQLAEYQCLPAGSTNPSPMVLQRCYGESGTDMLVRPTGAVKVPCMGTEDTTTCPGGERIGSYAMSGASIGRSTSVVSAMRCCAVLIQAMLLPGAAHSTAVQSVLPGTSRCTSKDTVKSNASNLDCTPVAHFAATHSFVFEYAQYKPSAICLRTCYTMPGTEIS
eukprot:3162254-Rhodomonas_salina.2